MRVRLEGRWCPCLEMDSPEAVADSAPSPLMPNPEQTLHAVCVSCASARQGFFHSSEALVLAGADGTLAAGFIPEIVCQISS